MLKKSWLALFGVTLFSLLCLRAFLFSETPNDPSLSPASLESSSTSSFRTQETWEGMAPALPSPTAPLPRSPPSSSSQQDEKLEGAGTVAAEAGGDWRPEPVDFEAIARWSAEDGKYPQRDRSKRRIFLTCLFMSTPEARRIIPYFVEHYRLWGIEPSHMLLTVQTRNASDPEFLATMRLLELLDVTPDYVEAEYTTFVNQEAYTKWWRIKNFTVDDWIIPLDMDEFHFYGVIPDRGSEAPQRVIFLSPTTEGQSTAAETDRRKGTSWRSQVLNGLLDRCDEEGWTYVHGNYRDRVNKMGNLSAIVPWSPKGPSLFRQYPLDCAMVNISGSKINKVLLHRAFLGADRGHHQIDPQIPPEFVNGRNLTTPPQLIRKPSHFFPVFHFKWTDNVLQLLNSRIETYRRLGLRAWGRSERYLKFIKEHNQRICVTCKWKGNPLCERGIDPFDPAYRPGALSQKSKSEP